jgi:hypothetical protein
LVVQSTAVQTHVHFTALSGPLANSSVRHGVAIAKASKGSEVADCLLCEQAALAGAYLLPQAVAAVPWPGTVWWHAASVVRQFGLVAQAHGWQSRAPPE